MRVKKNPQGHRLGVGETHTRGYTDVEWRHMRETGAARVAGPVPAAAMESARTRGTRAAGAPRS
jgi:hypothetical protein